jgi:protein-tyrosine phosphatase
MSSQDERRVLRLQGATNFRDLGGYLTPDGRQVRWGRIFRSDHLGRLTDDDEALLAALGLQRVLDFRGAQERAAMPNRLAAARHHTLGIEPVVVQRMQDLAAAGQRLSAAVAVDLMKDLYRGLVHDQAHRFAELFEHLLQADGPLVFHCTAGKDRTGFAAALVLHALGVPRAVVMQDYLLTNALYQPPPLPRTDTPAEALAVLWRVQADFLEAAFDALEADHGGVEQYLQQRLRVGPAARQALADRYLEPPAGL